MSSRWTTACALVLASVLSVVVGCWGGGAKRVPQSDFNPKAGADAVTMYDTNKDGKISGEELAAAPSLRAAIKQLDPGQTGQITAEMIDARVDSWRRTKLARVTVSCKVTRNNKPVPDATVTFVPEKWLGGKVVKASGKTNKFGVAMISIPTNSPRDPLGVGPGFYRVVITKDKLNIPEKYSSEEKTVFGQEVTSDAEGIKNHSGIKFDMKF